jgi:hypothetical protein
MNNQLISWSLFIVPWLTLFFMKREGIRRYITAALYTIVSSTIIFDLGIKLGWWAVLNVPYPFYSLQPFIYGLFPVVSMWVLYFTYGRLGIYLFTNLLLDIGLAYFFFGYIMPVTGLLSLVGMSRFQNLLLTLGHAITLYVVQMWQESAILPAFQNILPGHLRSAAFKPNFKDKNKK